MTSTQQAETHPFLMLPYGRLIYAAEGCTLRIVEERIPVAPEPFSPELIGRGDPSPRPS